MKRKLLRTLVCLAVVLCVAGTSIAFAAESTQDTPTPPAQDTDAPADTPTDTPAPTDAPEGTPGNMEMQPEDGKSVPDDIEERTQEQESPSPEPEAAAQAPVLPTAAELEQHIAGLAAYQLSTVKNPTVDTINGEWTVTDLARSGKITPALLETYQKNLYATLAEKKGVLHEQKYTEYSRVIIAVTATGGDARKVAGYDLTSYLSNIDNVKKQGNNGPIWALIALDTKQYPIPALTGTGTQTTREGLVQAILDAEVAGGGWSMSGAADAELTGMAIQALAPYIGGNAQAKAAVERAWGVLSAAQESTGGWSQCAEGTAQVVVAMASTGVSLEDPRFVKEGKTAYDGLMRYYIADKGAFAHSAGGGATPMATDQGMYALIALHRSMTGKTRLYDMSDVEFVQDETDEQRDKVTSAIDALPEDPGIKYKKEVADLQAQLKALPDFAEKSAYTKKLKDYSSAIADKEKQVNALDKDIRDKVNPLNISLSDIRMVNGLITAYNNLAKEDRVYVKNASSLKNARDILTSLQGGVIPAQVLSELREKVTTYKYQSTDGKVRVSIESGDVASATDMNVKLALGVTGPASIQAAMPDAYYFQLGQAGAMPAKATFRLVLGVQDGTYTLYRHDIADGKTYRYSEISLTGGVLNIRTDVGGLYFLSNTNISKPSPTPSRSTSNNGNSNRTSNNGNSSGGGSRSPRGNGDTDDGEDGESQSIAGEIVEQSVFEELQGQDENLVLSGVTEEGIEYSLTFNGLDITTPMAFDPGMSLSVDNAQYMARLAEDGAFMGMVFAHSGPLPGKMLVEVQTVFEDGDYMLFAYDPLEQRAEYETAVTVAEGWGAYSLTECSEYFIATRARKNSIAELDAMEKPPVEEPEEEEDEKIAAALNTMPEKKPPAAPKVAEPEPKPPEFEPWKMLVVLACAALAIIAILRLPDGTQQRKRGKRHELKLKS